MAALSDEFRHAPQSLENPFHSDDERSTFDLCESEFRVSSKVGPKFIVKGTLYVDLERYPNLFFRSSEPAWNDSAEKRLGSDEELIFESETVNLKGYVSRFYDDEDGFGLFAIFDFKQLDQSAPNTVHFLIPNSRLYGLEPIRHPTWAHYGRIRDSCKRYEIQIDRVQRDDQRRGDNKISHIAKISKTKGTFDSKEIESLAKKLQIAFSLLEGQWIAPILAFQDYETRKVVWFNTRLGWKSFKRLDNWHFDSRRTMDSKFFSKTFDFVSTEYNERVLLQSLGWHFESLEGNSFTKVLPNYIGLEMLAWAIVIEMNSTLSESGFEGLPTADKINLLINKIGLSNLIPEELGALKRYAQTSGFKLGPETVAKIRNSIVHPTRKHRDMLETLDEEVYEEAARLSQWYLESCFLYWIRYKGNACRPFGLHRRRTPNDCVPVDFES